MEAAMNYGQREKMKLIKNGKYSGSLQIPIKRYYDLSGYLGMLRMAINHEISRNLHLNLLLRDIIQGISIIIEGFSNEIFEKLNMAKAENLGSTIKKLKKINFLSEDQETFLLNFKDLRNFMAHQSVANKLKFNGKPLLIRSRIKNLVETMLQIIDSLEKKLGQNSNLNKSDIIKLLNCELPEKYAKNIQKYIDEFK